MENNSPHNYLLRNSNLYLELYKKTRSKIGKKGAIANIRTAMKALAKEHRHVIVYQGIFFFVEDIPDVTYVDTVKKQLSALARLKLFLLDEKLEEQIKNLAETYVIDIERFLKRQGFIFDDEIVIGWSKLEGEDNDKQQNLES